MDGWFTYSTGGHADLEGRVTHSDPDPRSINDVDTSTSKVTAPVVSVATTSAGTSDTGGTAPVVTVASAGTTGTTDSTPNTTDTTEAETVYDDAGRAISGPGAEGEGLADTGGPDRLTIWLGFALALTGAAVSAGARQRRPAPRHRGAALIW